VCVQIEQACLKNHPIYGLRYMGLTIIGVTIIHGLYDHWPTPIWSDLYKILFLRRPDRVSLFILRSYPSYWPLSHGVHRACM